MRSLVIFIIALLAGYSLIAFINVYFYINVFKDFFHPILDVLDYGVSNLTNSSPKNM